jgi:hypothetical protein
MSWDSIIPPDHWEHDLDVPLSEPRKYDPIEPVKLSDSRAICGRDIHGQPVSLPGMGRHVMTFGEEGEPEIAAFLLRHGLPHWHLCEEDFGSPHAA